MRLCTPLSLCLAAAAVLAPVSSAHARSDASPRCAATDARDFPLTARIHGGPATYVAGGGFGVWYIDLTNTTRLTCAAVHPVVVLVDDKRALKATQPHLEFYDGSRARPVHFETTDKNELVGVFDGDGFSGFTVAPGKTLTVKVRLSLTSDAVPNEITANAAVVQRHDKDGDWVGESNDYRFGVGDGGGGREGEGDSDGSSSSSSSSGDSDRGRGTGGGQSPAPSGSVPRSPGPSATGSSSPFSQEAQEAGEAARELARTGLGLGVVAVGIALLAVGGSTLLTARRRR